MPPPVRLPFGRPGQSVVHLQLGGYCPLAAWQASSPAPYLAHRAAQSKACRLLDTIRAGTSLGPPPFIQGREALNPQTAPRYGFGGKAGSGLCQTNGAPGLFCERCGAITLLGLQEAGAAHWIHWNRTGPAQKSKPAGCTPLQ